MLSESSRRPRLRSLLCSLVLGLLPACTAREARPDGPGKIHPPPTPPEGDSRVPAAPPMPAGSAGEDLERSLAPLQSIAVPVKQ